MVSGEQQGEEGWETSIAVTNPPVWTDIGVEGKPYERLADGSRMRYWCSRPVSGWWMSKHDEGLWRPTAAVRPPATDGIKAAQVRVLGLMTDGRGWSRAEDRVWGDYQQVMVWE